MGSHPYLRAYMAGVALPSMFMLIVLGLLIVARTVYRVPVAIERLLVFPMALVPSAWGVWNMLYVWIRARRKIPIGFYGAAFIPVWVPIAFAIQRALDFTIWTPVTFAVGFPIALVVYYLLWKHVVGFFNEVLGIA